VSLSRAWFDSTFQRHHWLFARGCTWCSGHPCQKHPSTKTANRARVNATSIVRRLFPGTLTCTRYLKPRLWSSRRSASSGAVSLRARLDMRLESSSSGRMRAGSLSVTDPVQHSRGESAMAWLSDGGRVWRLGSGAAEPTGREVALSLCRTMCCRTDQGHLPGAQALMLECTREAR
jgi:hypothetical protein